MTKQEWDQLWWEEFLKLRKENPASELILVHKATTQYMTKKYGDCPPAVHEAGPPWWMKLGALAIGVPMDWLTKFWAFMNGKKTVVGALITVVAYLVGGIPLVAALCTTAVCAATVVKAGGIGLTIVGILHKLYKFLYHENHE